MKNWHTMSLYDRFNCWTIITVASLCLILLFIIYPFSVLVIHSVVTAVYSF